MEPFNYERYKAGDPVQYRDGSYIKEILAFEHRPEELTFIKTVYYVSKDIYGTVFEHNKYGQYLPIVSMNAKDLFMVPEPKPEITVGTMYTEKEVRELTKQASLTAGNLDYLKWKTWWNSHKKETIKNQKT